MSRKPTRYLLAGLTVALLLAAFVSPYASSSPDGLEKVAANNGFIGKEQAKPAWQHTFFPDYGVPGLKNEKAATGLAGLAGTLAVFAAAYGVAHCLTPRRAAQAAQKEVS